MIFPERADKMSHAVDPHGFRNPAVDPQPALPGERFENRRGSFGPQTFQPQQERYMSYQQDRGFDNRGNQIGGQNRGGMQSLQSPKYVDPMAQKYFASQQTPQYLPTGPIPTNARGPMRSPQEPPVFTQQFNSPKSFPPAMHSPMFAQQPTWPAQEADFAHPPGPDFQLSESERAERMVHEELKRMRQREKELLSFLSNKQQHVIDRLHNQAPMPAMPQATPSDMYMRRHR